MQKKKVEFLKKKKSNGSPTAQLFHVHHCLKEGGKKRKRERATAILILSGDQSALKAPKKKWSLSFRVPRPPVHLFSDARSEQEEEGASGCHHLLPGDCVSGPCLSCIPKKKNVQRLIIFFWAIIS